MGPRSFVVMGPLPPPLDGVSVSTKRTAEILASAGSLAAIIDTTNPRSLSVMSGESRFGPRDIYRGSGDVVSLLRALLANPGADLYMNLSPTRGGLLRDAVLILTAAALRRRVVVHLHSSEGTRRSSECLTGPERALVRTALARVEQAWVLTDSLGESLVPPFRPGQIRVVPNCGDDLAAGAQPESVRGEGPLRLLFFSNLIPSKGYPELLDALAALGDLERGLELRIDGAIPGAEIEADLWARIARLPDSVRVEVRGAVPLEGRAAEYLWADAFVLPTSYPMESQPLTILEALSAGLPILSTLHAGIPETVNDGEEGILVAPGDPATLADAIRRLAVDPGLVESMSVASRRRFEAEFTAARYAERVRALLDVA